MTNKRIEEIRTATKTKKCGHAESAVQHVYELLQHIDGAQTSEHAIFITVSHAGEIRIIINGQYTVHCMAANASLSQCLSDVQHQCGLLVQQYKTFDEDRKGK